MIIIDEYMPLCSSCFNDEYPEVTQAEFVITTEESNGNKQTSHECLFHALSIFSYHVTHPELLPAKLEIDKIIWKRPSEHK